MVQQQSNRIAEFFARERQGLLRYLRGRISDLHEMELEDAIGEIILHLLDKADLAGQVENLSAYIYRSVRNKLLDQVRRGKRLVPLASPAGSGEEDRPVLTEVDSGFDLLAEIESREFRSRLATALDGLEPRQRAVWIATELEGYSFRELAEIWGEPIGTLLARKHRATAALQKALAGWKEG